MAQAYAGTLIGRQSHLQRVNVIMISHRRFLVVIILTLLLLAGCDYPGPARRPSPTLSRAATRTILATTVQPTATPVPPTLTRTKTLVPTATLRPTATGTRTPLPGATPTTTPSHTSTSTPTRTRAATRTATAGPTATRTPRPSPTLTPTRRPRVYPPAVLANYLPWYDPATWDTGCTSGQDRPRDGVYSSDDGEVIARHIAQARTAGLDGFAVHWFARDNRTDRNLRQVLDRAPEGFYVTVTFLHHILPGIKQQGVIDALRYISSEYSQHPRFFRVADKPVLMFSDMYRVPNASGDRPASDQEAIANWTAVRQAVDPGHSAWWIAEGLQPDYLAVFDGLYVYKTDHACCPDGYRSASRWAGAVRDWAERAGQPKLWMATVMPGWDDLNSAQVQCADLRVSSDPFARDRAGGAYYDRLWEAALATEPDLVLVHSFNEWVEGSYIEPSVKFGDRYLTLTAQWAARFKSRE